MKTELLPCPCGEIPTGFGYPDTFSKYVHVTPNCCSEWGFEVRLEYRLSDEECKTKIEKAWNDMPRCW